MGLVEQIGMPAKKKWSLLHLVSEISADTLMKEKSLHHLVCIWPYSKDGGKQACRQICMQETYSCRRYIHFTDMFTVLAVRSKAKTSYAKAVVH